VQDPARGYNTGCLEHRVGGVKNRVCFPARYGTACRPTASNARSSWAAVAAFMPAHYTVFTHLRYSHFQFTQVPILLQYSSSVEIPFRYPRDPFSTRVYRSTQNPVSPMKKRGRNYSRRRNERGKLWQKSDFLSRSGGRTLCYSADLAFSSADQTENALPALLYTARTLWTCSESASKRSSDSDREVYGTKQLTLERTEVVTAVTMKNGVFWDVTSCGSCKNRRFGGT
jgi:hypothetical protein